MKKFLKKTAFLAMATLTAFGVVACGGGGDDGGVDASGNTVVKVMFHVDLSSNEGMASCRNNTILIGKQAKIIRFKESLLLSILAH